MKKAIMLLTAFMFSGSLSLFAAEELNEQVGQDSVNSESAPSEDQTEMSTDFDTLRHRHGGWHHHRRHGRYGRYGRHGRWGRHHGGHYGRRCGRWGHRCAEPQAVESTMQSEQAYTCSIDLAGDTFIGSGDTQLEATQSAQLDCEENVSTEANECSSEVVTCTLNE